MIQYKFNQCAARSRNDFVPIDIGYDQAMFNHPPDGLKDQEKRNFINIIMIIKHVLYRLKFRENLDRVPSTRLVITIACIEMEKASMVRDYLGKTSITFNSFIGVFKEHAWFSPVTKVRLMTHSKAKLKPFMTHMIFLI